MTKLVAETGSAHNIASQYDRSGIFQSLSSVLEATLRALVFARHCERHFNRHGRISSETMARIAKQTRLSNAA